MGFFLHEENGVSCDSFRYMSTGLVTSWCRCLDFVLDGRGHRILTKNYLKVVFLEASEQNTFLHKKTHNQKTHRCYKS